MADYPTKPLVSYRIYRQLSVWNPPPLVIRAFGAHCQEQTFNISASTRKGPAQCQPAHNLVSRIGLSTAFFFEDQAVGFPVASPALCHCRSQAATATEKKHHSSPDDSQ